MLKARNSADVFCKQGDSSLRKFLKLRTQKVQSEPFYEITAGKEAMNFKQPIAEIWALRLYKK